MTFKESTLIFVLMRKVRKGRNPLLINERDLRLSARYYFYTSIIGLNFTKCLQYLEVEFNLSEARITDVLAENSDTVSQLITSQVTDKHLQQAYPFMNWRYNHYTMSQKPAELLLNLSLSV